MRIFDVFMTSLFLFCVVLAGICNCAPSQSAPYRLSLNNIDSSLNDIRDFIRRIYGSLDEFSSKLDALQGFLGCERGWHKLGLTCYFVSTEKLTWQQSLQKCQQMGANFVKIITDKEYNFIRGLADGKDAWIGLQDAKGDNVYRWAKDNSVQPMIDHWWGEGEPNSLDERCVHFSDARRWNDIICSHHFRYICDKPARLTVYSP